MMIVYRTPAYAVQKSTKQHMQKNSGCYDYRTNDVHDSTAAATLTFSLLSAYLMSSTSTHDTALPPSLTITYIRLWLHLCLQGALLYCCTITSTTSTTKNYEYIVRVPGYPGTRTIWERCLKTGTRPRVRVRVVYLESSGTRLQRVLDGVQLYVDW